MKSRLFRFLYLFFFCILLVTACNGLTTLRSDRESPPLKVVYNAWPGYFPMIIAQEKGYFQKEGVKVEPFYTESYLASMSDFSAGKYDGIGLALGSLMSVIEKNVDAQIVLMTDRSAGADVVVAQGNIQSVADLKGKQIGAKLRDFGELFVSRMLEINGLTANDVKLVNLEGEEIPVHLKSGDIQAGHTWEPHLFQAVKSGAKVIFSTKQTPGLIPAGIVFRSQVIRDRPSDILAFIRAWFQAQDYWKANPEESKTLIARKLNIKPQEVSTDGIELLNLKDNLKTFTPGASTESLYYTTKLYMDFYVRTGGLSATADVQKLINPSFVRQLE